LTDRRFLPYFLSQSSGDAGYAVYAISIPWLAYQIGGNVALGLALLAEFGIYSLSFLAGPVIDRVGDLRTVLLIGYAAQGVLAVLLGLLATRGHLTVATLLAVVIPLSAIWDFTWAAMNAMPPRIVPSGDLLRANGLLGAVSGGNQIAGYAAGAGLVLLVGPGSGMFLYGALNAFAAILALAVHGHRPAGPVVAFGASFREGWSYFVGGAGRPRLQISLASASQSFVSAAPVLLMTVLAATSTGDGARPYAISFTGFAFGGVVGSLLIGQYAPRDRLGFVLSVVAIVEGVLLLAAVLLFPGEPWTAPAWIAVGVVDVGFYTLLLTYFQATSPPALVGRTVTNAYLFRGLSRAAGGFFLAAVLIVVSPLGLAIAVAVALVGVGVGAPLGLPAVRRMGF
jgi:MFS family permease